MGIPPWAWYAFGVCFALIVIFLLLDYLVIRRNALGNTCCLSGKTRKRTPGQAQTPTFEIHHVKRSTNMVLSV
ncbi:Protein F35H12.6 [Aphelenchoides avenae]|nr:Protein F35H12.6 [Aphelenchus avenae]